MLRHALLPLAAATLLAQAPAAKKPVAPSQAWTNVTTLSFVGSSGNSRGQAFGFTNVFTMKWDAFLFSANLGAIRSASTVTERKAFSNQLPYVQYSEKDITTVTAEQYYGNGRLEWKFADAWYWYGGGGWERNRPAGIEDRSSIATGVGRVWVDTEATKFKTDLGVGNTWDNLAYEPADFKDSYTTGVLTASFRQKLGPVAILTADLAYTSELSNSTNWYGVGRFGLSASMSTHLALKVGVDLTYRNVPGRIQVPVYTFNPPVVELGKHVVEAKKTDVVYTTGLVVTF